MRISPDSLRNDRDLRLPDVTVDIKNQTTRDAGQVSFSDPERNQIQSEEREARNQDSNCHGVRESGARG